LNDLISASKRCRQHIKAERLGPCLFRLSRQFLS